MPQRRTRRTSLNLNHIASFIKVVETGSFTAAAAELSLSPSALSKDVAQLEASLGAPLLVRTTRRLSLTDAGARYFERCGDVMAELGDAAEEAMAQSGDLRGPLRVHATPGVGQRLIAPALARFLKAHSGATAALTIGEALGPPQNADVTVTITHKGEARGKSVQAEHLAEVTYLVCAAPAYIERCERPLRPADLKNHNCLIQESQRAPRIWRFRQPDGSITSVSVNGSFASNNPQSLEEVVLAGVGVGRIPDYAAAAHVEAGRLVVLFDNLVAWGQVVTAFVPEGRQNARCNRFLEFLRNDLRASAAQQPVARPPLTRPEE